MSYTVDFPARVLSLNSKIKKTSILFVVFSFFIGIAWVTIASYFVGLDLITDTQIGTDYVIDDQGTFGGQCTYMDYVIRSCDAAIISGDKSRSEYIFFLGFRPGDFSSYVVLSKDNQLALETGQQNLINRWVTFVGILIVGLTFPSGALSQYRRRNRVATEAYAMKNSELKPVEVEIKSIQKRSIIGHIWGYNFPNEKEVYLAAMPRKFEPLKLSNKVPDRFLAVVREDIQIPVLVDKNLTEISFTENERSLILSKISQS
jgi:hypothetical protein